MVDLSGKLLVIDTETGGFDPANHSILSLGAVVWDHGDLDATCEIFVAEPTILAEQESLDINGISPEWLRENGCKPGEAVVRLERFLEDHFGPVDRRLKIMIGGHNVWFDVAFLQRLYRFANREYRESFHHRTLDIQSVASFLQLTGHVSVADTRTDALFEHFGVAPPPEQRHRALADAIAEAGTLTAMWRLLR